MELEMRRAQGAERSETARSPSSAPERTRAREALEAELAQKHWDAWIDTRCRHSGSGRRAKPQKRRGGASGWLRSSPTSRARRNGVHWVSGIQCARQCAQTRSEDHQSAANPNQVPNKKRA